MGQTFAILATAWAALLSPAPLSSGAEDKEASRRAVQLTKEAAALQKTGDLPGARADLVEAKRLVPATNPEARKDIDAFLLLADEGLDGISETFKKQEQLTSEANALQKKGDLPAALKKANEAVEIMRGKEEPRFARASILMDLQQYKEAAEDWTFLAKGIGPDNEHASYIYYSRGLCRLVLDDRAGAQADASEAKRLAPKNLGNNEKEQIQNLLRESTPAAADRARNQGAGSEDKTALFGKIDQLGKEALELKGKGNLPGAVKKLSEAIDSMPAGDLPRGLREGAYALRATLLMDLKRYKEAIEDWTLLEKWLQPGDPLAYLTYKNRGVCRLALGDAVSAHLDASEAKRLAPKTISPKDREDLELLLRMTDDGIAQAAKDAIDLDGPLGWDLFKKQKELTAEAEALQKKDDLPGALKKINEAVDLLFTQPDPRARRADILMDLKRYKEALKDWDYLAGPVFDMEAGGFVDLDHDFIHYERGICRLKLGDRKGAQADALEAKRLAPKTIDPEDLKDIEVLRIRSAPAFPLGGNWARVITENGRQIAGIWELHADGKCVIHFQTIRPGGQYSGSGPSNRAWPGDERTRFGEATFRDGRWRMTFAEPKGSTATGTYEFSPDSQELLGTQDGVEGRFTRKLVTVNPDSTPEPTPVADRAQAEGKSRAVPGQTALDYFDWGQEVCSLGHYFYYQRIASDKEAPIARQRALLERLQSGTELLANLDVLAKLVREANFPTGDYNSWTKEDQHRWDKEFKPASAALANASNRLIAKTPESEFFYLLGFETCVLSVALPENVRTRGLRNAVTRSELQKGLAGFVWLRAKMPPNGLAPEVAAAVKGLANYKAQVGEALPPADAEKIIALAKAISDARDTGKLFQ